VLDALLLLWRLIGEIERAFIVVKEWYEGAAER
jgi:hypothetical protein